MEILLWVYVISTAATATILGLDLYKELEADLTRASSNVMWSDVFLLFCITVCPLINSVFVICQLLNYTYAVFDKLKTPVIRRRK